MAYFLNNRDLNRYKMTDTINNYGNCDVGDVVSSITDEYITSIKIRIYNNLFAHRYMISSNL